MALQIIISCNERVCKNVIRVDFKGNPADKSKYCLIYPGLRWRHVLSGVDLTGVSFMTIQYRKHEIRELDEIEAFLKSRGCKQVFLKGCRFLSDM